MYEEVRLGRDWPAIAHLNYWKDREVDEFTMSLMANYENFMHYTFQCRWNVKPTRIQLQIGKWFAGTVDPHDPDGHLRGVMAFRAATKTAIASNYCVYLTLLDPRLSVKVISSKDELAKKITKECRVWYDVVDVLEELIHPNLNTGSSAMMDNANSFNVLGNPGGKDTTFSAVAVTGNITGSRAHIVLMDDVEVPSLCDTADKREKLKRYDSEINNILFDKKACEAIGILFDGFRPFKTYTGTPHTTESLYEHKQTQGYKFRIWPGRYPNTKFMKTIGHLVAPELLEDMQRDPSLCTGYGCDFQQGRVVDAERQSEESMLTKEIEEGKAGFALQYYLDYSLQNVDKYPLKLNDLIVCDLDSKRARANYMSEREPQFEIKGLPVVGLSGDRYYMPSYMSPDSYEYERIVMAIDNSGQGSDETTYSIVATLNGNFFLLDNGGMGGYDNGFSDEVLQSLANIAKRWQVNQIYVEQNFGDGMFHKMLTPFIQNTYPCSIENSRASGQKEVRIIETLEPVMSRRRLIVNRELIQRDYDEVPMKAKESERPSYRLFYQMSRITRERQSLRHDDRLDSLELAIRMVSDSLSIDEKKAEEDKFMRQVLAKKNTERSMRMFLGGAAPKAQTTFFKSRRR